MTDSQPPIQTEAPLPALRMQAYYFGFSETGVRCVDEILSAVATAGKGCHHTEDWSEYGYPEKIQAAAGAAAGEIRRLRDALTMIAEQTLCPDLWKEEQRKNWSEDELAYRTALVIAAAALEPARAK